MIIEYLKKWWGTLEQFIIKKFNKENLITEDETAMIINVF